MGVVKRESEIPGQWNDDAFEAIPDKTGENTKLTLTKQGQEGKIS